MFNPLVKLKSLWRGKWLELLQYSNTNKTSEIIKRTTSDRYYSGVNSLCFRNSQILLIKNLRIPTQTHIIELPAGLCETNFTVEENGRREVQEETGFTVKNYWDNWGSNEMPGDPVSSNEGGYI